MSDKHLATWLDDHLAMATGAAELARRTRRENDDSPLAPQLDRLASELDGQREGIKTVLGALGTQPSQVKQVAGWLAEKAGRLKLNEKIMTYSSLSRLEELEGLLLAAASLGVMWRSLERVRGEHGAFDTVDITDMAEKAEHMLDELRGMMTTAADEALALT